MNVLFLCAYALSMVLFLVSFRRRRRQAGTDEAGEGGRIDVAVVGGSRPLAAPERVRADAVSGSGFASGSDAGRDPRASLDARFDALGLADPFSKREREVVALVLRGNNVPAVARKLYISENTVRDHMKSIYRKAGVHSRQELIDLLD